MDVYIEAFKIDREKKRYIEINFSESTYEDIEIAR